MQIFNSIVYVIAVVSQNSLEWSKRVVVILARFLEYYRLFFLQICVDMYQDVGEMVSTVHSTSRVSKQWYENKYLVCFPLLEHKRVHTEATGRYCD